MKGKAFLIAALCTLAPALAVPAVASSSPSAQSSRTGFAYHWPIKPFDSQHPIRGAFGDPRIVSAADPFGWTGPDKIGAHSFHNGIDIVAPPGTPVYPVVSGRVVRAKSDEIVIDTYDGRAFQYYHLTKARRIQPGRLVVAERTVLGWIRETYGHVHLAEIDDHLIHNPLDRGHLEPYYDHTRPEATDLYVNDSSLPSPLDGRAISPGDRLSVDAADPPARAVPFPWDNCPQAPALVEWRLFHGGKGTPWKVAADFRQTEPPPRYFWQVYGAGTYQNTPTFENHIYHGMAGRYLFRLPIQPAELSPGLYRLAVRVSDIRGNQSTAWWPLQIAH